MSTKKLPSKKNLAQQLTASRNYLNNILTLLPEHIYWMDLDGKIIGCNEQQAKSFGLSSSNDLIGMNIYDVAKLLHWNESIPRAIRKNDREIMTTGIPKIVEEIVLLQNKNKVFLSHKSPLRDENGEVIGIIGVATDITEIKETQAKIIQLEKEKTIIETKRQTISDLAASITHEIGNLLGGIMVNMQLLDSDLRPKIKKLIKQYHGKYQRTLELLNDIEQSMEKAKFMFESIKLNIRNGDINKNQFELANIADDIESVLNACFPGEENVAGIKWNKNDSFEYIGIPAYTRNILINLIKNALHFIKEEKKGKITLALRKGKKFNQLIVRDTSKGIPKNILPKIFNSFSTTRKGGMGMGLAFCKRVMKEYGGDIVCDSQLNKYAQFTLTFPVVIID